MKLSLHDEPLPAKCPVVYLPGVDGTGRLLHRQTGLAERFTLRCVNYPQDDRHTYADLVSLGVKQLEETGPGVVLAESFGGAVGLMIALARPELVRRLVLVNTFAWYPRRLFIGVMGLVGPWLPNSPSHPATRDVRGLFFFGPRISKAEQDAWWDRTADVPMRAYGHRFRMIAELDLRPRLPEINIPALVFTSPNDWVVPATAGRLLAKRLPRARRIGQPVGHAAMIDPRVDVAAWLEKSDYWAAVN
ncbi:MAG: lysophospholipase [Planctomycetes bacterium]|nr:lysophospholipase [Planctomycetota bacterium]